MATNTKKLNKSVAGKGGSVWDKLNPEEYKYQSVLIEELQDNTVFVHDVTFHPGMDNKPFAIVGVTYANEELEQDRFEMRTGAALVMMFLKDVKALRESGDKTPVGVTFVRKGNSYVVVPFEGEYQGTLPGLSQGEIPF